MVIIARQRNFRRSAASARDAREFVIETLAAWRLRGRMDDVRLCVSEVATNAILHGTVPGERFLVRVIRSQDAVGIEVEDGGDGCPQRRWPESDDCSGRGLVLVGELSDAYGVDRNAVGKLVWMTFKDTTEERRNMVGEGAVGDSQQQG